MAQMNGLLSLIAIGSLLGIGGDERLIDRGYLYCIPCGRERLVSENGDVEACPNEKCDGKAYNLYEQRLEGL